MRSPEVMEIIEIDVTNACIHQCSHCTRFCGHHKKPFFMDFEMFKKAVDSLEGYDGLAGFMGGEPTLHPDFERMARHLAERRPTPKFEKMLNPVKNFSSFVNRNLSRREGNKLGLFSALGTKYYQYFEIIQDIFPFQGINDHSNSVLHQALLIPRTELGIPDAEWYPKRDACWLQNLWSAGITPKGAFFCEVAAAMDMLFDGPGGWPLEPGWWKRTPADFGDQLKWCELCSAPLAVPRMRAEDENDVLSPLLYERLKQLGSPKLKHGRVAKFDTATYDASKYQSNTDDGIWYFPGDAINRRAASTNSTIHPKSFALYLRPGASTPEDAFDAVLDTPAFESLSFKDWCVVAMDGAQVDGKLASRLHSVILNPGCVYHFNPTAAGVAWKGGDALADSLVLLFNRNALALRGADSIDSSLRFLSRWDKEKIVRLDDDFDADEAPKTLPGLDEAVKRELMTAHFLALWASLSSTYRRIALYGAGKHTSYVLSQIKGFQLPTPCLIADDKPQVSDLQGVPVRGTATIPISDFDCMVVSSDTYHREMFKRVTANWPKAKAVDPYVHFLNPVYDKGCSAGGNAGGNQMDAVGVQDNYPVLREMDRNGIEILANTAFQNSCKALGGSTLLDTPRLANLWDLCRLTDPKGAMLEIGTYKGGGALHLSNCCPERQIIVCDPLDKRSFESLDPKLDSLFHLGEFSDTSKAAVEDLLKDRNARIIPGYFPASVKGITLPKLSFVHLDVDVYRATINSLLFLLAEGMLCGKSLIVLDDFRRGAAGVDRAVEEIVAEIKGVAAFPLFPGQALVVPQSWYEQTCGEANRRPAKVTTAAGFDRGSTCFHASGEQK